MKKGRIYISTRMIKFVKYKSVVTRLLLHLLSKRKFAKFAFIRLYKNIVNFSLHPRLIVWWLVWEYMYQCFFFCGMKGTPCERNEIIPMDKASKEVSQKDKLYVVSGERIFLDNKICVHHWKLSQSEIMLISIFTQTHLSQISPPWLEHKWITYKHCLCKTSPFLFVYIYF